MSTQQPHESRRTIRCMVAATNAGGEPDIYFVKVKATDSEANDGQHYEAAKRSALTEGYEPPMVAFDEHDVAGNAMLELFTWEFNLRTASVVESAEEF